MNSYRYKDVAVSFWNMLGPRQQSLVHVSTAVDLDGFGCGHVRKCFPLSSAISSVPSRVLSLGIVGVREEGECDVVVRIESSWCKVVMDIYYVCHVHHLRTVKLSLVIT
jgi:hypothetical protein